MGKRLVSTLLVVVMVAMIALTGCGSDSSSSSGGDSQVTNVSFWTLNSRQEAVEDIVAAFNEANPDIKVTASFYDTDGIKDACKVSASSDSLPNMWFNWGGSLADFYVKNELTYDLTEYASKNDWTNKFTGSSLDLCTMEGKLSGYPTSYNTIGIYYRKDIFDQYNIAVPTTFEEFEQACATLKENGITPISTAGLNGWHVMRFVELLIEHYAGAEQHDAMNSFETSYDNDATVEALTKYQEFVEKGYFPNGFVTASPEDTNMAFFSGTAAMDIQGQWYDGIILQEGQDMDNYGTFAFPSGGANRMSAFAEMTQFNANNSDAELDACIKFMDYYYSEENTSKYAEYYNLPLPTVDAAMPEGQPNAPILLETSEENGTFTITDQAFPTEVADVLFNVQDAIANGEMQPSEGAAMIQEGIEAYNAK